MRIYFTIGALAGLVIGSRHFGNYLSAKRKNLATARRLEVWENEGGAIAAGTGRTAQQVSPREASRASPPGVA